MYIIVGLGNPGNKYFRTRHNAGFDVVELLCAKWGVKLKKTAHKALIGEYFIAGEKIILALPQTYMNESGQSVMSLVDYYGVDMDKLIVVYDDIDLEPGTIRVRASGSAGTHNGMRSVIYLLESQDFPRVRIGVGKPPPEWQLSDYVLAKPPVELHETMFESFKRAAEAVESIIAEGVEATQAKYNGAI